MNIELDFLMGNTPAPVFVTNDEGKIIGLNHKMATILGKELNPQDLTLDVILDSNSYQLIREYLSNDNSYESDAPVLVKLLSGMTSNEANVELSWKRLSLDGITYWFFVAYDIESYKQEISYLTKYALNDELTGINNRWSFFNKFDLEVEKEKRYKHSLSLILIDIDHFKKINDCYGHPAGDQLLLSFCNCVQPLLRGCDVFARLGGDEFAVLMPETSVNQAYHAASRIKNMINKTSFHIATVRISLSCSLGVSTMAGSETNRKILMKKSDVALYRAKSSGRNKVVIENLCVA